MIDLDKFSSFQHLEEGNCSGFFQEIPYNVFLPIGSRAEDPENIEVYYFTDIDARPDSVWMKERFPFDVPSLIDLLKEAFKEYYRPERCGEDIKPDVIEALSDQMYPVDSVELFLSEGYIPFFEIQMLKFYPKSDVIIISGRTDIDYNLVEHGIDIKFSTSGVDFGYRCDFDDELTESKATGYR